MIICHSCKQPQPDAFIDGTVTGGVYDVKLNSSHISEILTL